MKRLITYFLLLLVAIALVGCTVSCISDSSSGSVREIFVEIHQGKIDSDISIIQGDKVKFKITSDRAGVLHIHGYDLRTDVFQDKTSSIEFVAKATGSFKLGLHEASDGHQDHSQSDDEKKEDGHQKNYNEHGAVFSSEVLNPGESFSFKITENLKGATIPFHDHMQHSVKPGNIIVNNKPVTEGGNLFEGIHILIKVGEFFPSEVNVYIGDIIIWKNDSGEKSAIRSGLMGESDTHEHGEEEVIIGNLKVVPK